MRAALLFAAVVLVARASLSAQVVVIGNPCAPNGYWTGVGCIYPVTPVAGAVADDLQRMQRQRELEAAARPKVAAAQPMPVQPAAQRGAPIELLVFGGVGHQVFLGCLSCETGPLSMTAWTTPYGSVTGLMSVSNPLTIYGNTSSPYSACNRTATDPPVIVDSLGNSRGRLTVNLSHPERAKAEDVKVWIFAVCGA